MQEKERYLHLQQILEKGEYPSCTNAIIQCMHSTIGDWKNIKADILAVQCGNSIFFDTLTNLLPHFCIIEPCSETFIELQRRYLHLPLFGNSFNHIQADTNSFTNSIIVYPTLYMNTIDSMLQEVMRVTSESIVCFFFNKFSLEYLLYIRKQRSLSCVWNTPYSVINKIRAIQCTATIRFRSIGFFPIFSARTAQRYYPEYSVPIGSIMAVSIDMPRERVRTPILEAIPSNRKAVFAWGSPSSCNKSTVQQ